MKQKRMGIVTKLVLAALLLYALLASLQMQKRIEAAEAERETLRLKAQSLALQNASLAHEIEHSGDPDTIEKVAREKLGLVLPGEVVFYDLGN